jgi:hypothetical protein
VAVRLERAHAEFRSQRQRLAIIIFGLRALRRLTTRGDVAEEAQGIRLGTPCLVCTGMRQRTLGEDVRIRQTAAQRLRLPQGETPERLIACCRDSAPLRRLCEQ